MVDRTGNLPPQPGIFPDYMAPIVRNAAGGRELTLARWGMPTSSQALFEVTKKRAQKLEVKGKRPLAEGFAVEALQAFAYEGTALLLPLPDQQGTPRGAAAQR